MKPFDQNGDFRPSAGRHDLRRTAVRGASVTVISQGIVFAVQTVATLSLARLLTPMDFGILAMVSTFSVVLMSVGQNGYAEAIMQREEMNESLASNLFWITFGIGTLLSLVFAACGPLLVRLYGNKLVAPVTVWMALTIFINSTSVVHVALLKRALRFSLTSTLNIISSIGSVVVSIILALMGWGYWALVVGAIVKPLVLSIGAWYQCPWIPKFPRRTPGTASVVRFALNVYGRFSFDYCTRNTDNLLVGWRFGPSSLGYYKKAYDLFVLPANQLIIPVADVVLSTLGKLKPKSIEYKTYFLRGLSILAFSGMAVGGILTLAGKDLIRVLLGAKWAPAGEIFVFFGPGIGIMLIYMTSGLLHLSIGRADRWLKWVAVEFVTTVLLFLLGLRWGPVGVASAWTASFCILLVPAFWFAGKPVALSVGSVLATVWRYVLASLVAGLACVLVTRQIPLFAGSADFLIAVLRACTVSLLYLALYLGAIVLLYGGPQPLYRFAQLLPDLLPGKRSRGAVDSPPEVAPSKASELSEEESAIPETYRR